MGANALTPLKRVEWFFKTVLAMLAAVLLFRPWRRPRACRLLRQPRLRVLVVRLDNRVGEALLTTPLLNGLAQAGHEVHLLAHPKMHRVLAGHPALHRLWAYQPRWTVLRALRAERFEAVINCGNWAEPAVTSALVSRLIASHGVVLGPANFPSGWLMDVPVAALGDTPAEAVQRRHLGSPLLPTVGPAKLSFKPTAPFRVVDGRYAVVNPGGRLGFRRVPIERFIEAATELLSVGVTPVVTWGPGEEALAEAIVSRSPGCVRAPATDIEQLASLMREACLTVCNNTGPMHLSVAVGCPTLALFLHMDVQRWGHAEAPHHMLDLTLAEEPAQLTRAAVRAMAHLPLGH
jgi:heptosyltransferase III